MLTAGETKITKIYPLPSTSSNKQKTYQTNIYSNYGKFYETTEHGGHWRHPGSDDIRTEFLELTGSTPEDQGEKECSKQKEQSWKSLDFPLGKVGSLQWCTLIWVLGT